MVPLSALYLGTTQSTPMNSPLFARPQSMSQASLPQSAQAVKAANRASMPPPSRTPTSPTRTESLSKVVRKTFEPTPEEGVDGGESQGVASQTKPTRNRGPPRVRHGTMDREFKFPVSFVSPDSDTAVHGQQAASTGTKDTLHAPTKPTKPG